MTKEEKITLKELVDLNEVQSIQDSFAKTVGTSSVIFSPEGEPLTRFSNPTSFCSLIQSTEEGRRRCFQSFMKMSRKALELKEPKILYCFAHGGHFVAPIIIDGEHKGTMFAGQFIPHKLSDEQLTEIRRIAEEINIDPELLVKEAKRMRVVEEEAVWNYSSLLFQIVSVIARLGAQAGELNRAKGKLQKAHDELEMRVEERTAELAKTTEDLRREKERAEKYLNIAGVMLAIVDANEKISLINKKGCEILGYKEKELIGRNWFDTLVPKRIRGKIKGVFGKLMAGDIEPVEYYENPLLTKEGEERLIAFHNTVIRDQNGQIEEVLFSGEDITERKRAEEELQRSEEKYRTVVESINDIIFTLDREGKFTYLSPRFEVATGYRPEDLIGHSFTEVLAPEYIESTVDSFRRGLSGETIPLYEVELLLRDGRRLPIELNVTSLLDAEGQPIGRLGVARDISERKKMEDKLQRSQAQYRTIFEATSVPTVILDEDGTFYRVNAEAAKISGFTKEELEGKKSWTEFIAKKEDLEMMKEIHRLRRTDPDKVPRNYEFLFKDRYGNTRNIYVTAAVIPRTKRSVVSFMDLTERKQAEEALRESEEKYRTFIERTSEGYWGLNLEHKTSEVNQSLCDMLGYKKEEMMGKSPHDFVDEENLKIFKYQMGKIESTLNRSYEIVLKNKNGEDVFTRFNATTIIDDTGEFKGAYSLVTNITEQKKAEEALRESSAKIRSITASAHDAVIMVDDEENISFWNEAAERIFGYSEEEMIGTKLHGSLIPERFREDALNGFKSFRETGQGAAVGKTLELAANRKDGTELPVELSLSAVKIKGKWNAIGVIRDISERKQAEEKLMKKTEELERFNKLAVGRELKMIELKKEINALLEQLGKEPRYKIVGES